MRLGRDAIVFTKTSDSKSVGFLSQTYLEAIKAETILVPMVTWDSDGNILYKDWNILRGAVLKVAIDLIVRLTSAILYLHVRAKLKFGALLDMICLHRRRQAYSLFEGNLAVFKLIFT